MKFRQKQISSTDKMLQIIKYFTVIFTCISLFYIICFTYIYYINYSDNINKYNKQTHENIDAATLRFQTFGASILSEYHVAFLLHFQNRYNAEYTEEASRYLQTFHYYNDINSIKIIDTNSQSIWCDNNLTPTPLNERVENYKYYKKILDSDTNGMDFFADDKRDMITYVYKDFRDYLVLFDIKKQNFASLVLPSPAFPTCIYQSGRIILNTASDTPAGIEKHLKPEKETATYITKCIARNIYKQSRLTYITSVSLHQIISNTLYKLIYIYIVSLIFLSLAYAAIFQIRKNARNYATVIKEKNAIEQDVVNSTINRALFNILSQKNRAVGLYLPKLVSFNHGLFYPIIITVDSLSLLNFPESLENLITDSFSSQSENTGVKLIGFTLYEAHIMYVVNADSQEQIINSLTHVHDLILSNYSINCLYMIGKKYDSLNELLSDSGGIYTVVQYMFLTEYNKIYTAENVPAVTATPDYPISVQYALVDCIKSNNSSNVTALLTEFVEYYRKQNFLLLKETLFTLYFNLLRKSTSFQNKYIDYDTIKMFFLCATANDSIKIFTDTLFTSKDDENYPANQHFKEMADANITQRFSDPNYDLNAFATEFDITSAYAGQKFKMVFGLSFTQYLSNYRMDFAKRLLAETNKKILEISTVCGYNSSTYFTSTFKKAVGMTPNQYRNTHCNQDK